MRAARGHHGAGTHGGGIASRRACCRGGAPAPAAFPSGGGPRSRERPAGTKRESSTRPKHQRTRAITAPQGSKRGPGRDSADGHGRLHTHINLADDNRGWPAPRNDTAQPARHDCTGRSRYSWRDPPRLCMSLRRPGLCFAAPGNLRGSLEAAMAPGRWNALRQMPNHVMAFKLMDCDFVGGSAVADTIAPFVYAFMLAGGFAERFGERRAALWGQRRRCCGMSSPSTFLGAPPAAPGNHRLLSTE